MTSFPRPHPLGRVPLDVSWTSPFPSRLVTTIGRIEFALLRTGRSPPVALHPLSQGRSYHQLQSSNQTLTRTSTSLIRTLTGALGPASPAFCFEEQTSLLHLTHRWPAEPALQLLASQFSTPSKCRAGSRLPSLENRNKSAGGSLPYITAEEKPKPKRVGLTKAQDPENLTFEEAWRSWNFPSGSAITRKQRRSSKSAWGCMVLMCSTTKPTATSTKKRTPTSSKANL